MPIRSLLLLLPWALMAVARTKTDAFPNVNNLSDHSFTNKFIVELDHPSRVGHISKQMAVNPTKQPSYYRAFDCSDIFVGIAIETNGDNIDSLREYEGVANVWQMQAVSRPSVVSSTDVPFEARQRLHNYSLHQWTGVDRLHKQGIRGKGAVVAVVDTGIDYTHKALGGCFGEGCKVSGGYDLVGKTWDERFPQFEPKVPDDNPIDAFGHGTHVAGIIAADNDWLTGVAPDATLLSFKVFSDIPWDTNEETLIQAYCDAYNSGADIITTSVGKTNGFSDNPWALVASRLVSKGVVVTISAGNDGQDGPFDTSSGSNGYHVLSVAGINVTSHTNMSTSDPRWSPSAASFTTWGPTNEMLLKPDIGAPSVDVVSTWIDQKYQKLSGTSMAAPYIAGVAALYVGKYGGRAAHGPGFAEMLSRRIASSGSSVGWHAGQIRRDRKAPPFQVGTGLINATKVLQYETDVAYESFSLLDRTLFRPDWNITITNRGSDIVHYNYSLEAQSGVYLYDAFYGIELLPKMKPVYISPQVIFPPTITLGPEESQSVSFHFEQPIGMKDDYLPLYGGKVWIHSDTGESVSIPYGGVGYDTETAFDAMWAGKPYIADYDSNWTWAFDVERNSLDFVELESRLAYACTNLRWDIFDGQYDEYKWSFPPKIGVNNYVGSATTMRNTELYWFFEPGVNNPNDTIPFPLNGVPRGYSAYWWFGKMADGTQIKPGNYSMRFAALRPYGNPNISHHWDIMDTPFTTFEVTPKYHIEAARNMTNATIPRYESRIRRASLQKLKKYE